MSSGKRQILEAEKAPQEGTHAGLWLDKFLEDDSGRDDLVQQVAAIREPDVYKAFYERWKAALEAHGARCRLAEVQGRLAINLGAESVLEAGIALHHTYGLPYIPGSALKGLAAAFAHQHLEGEEWRKEVGWAHKELFGTMALAGCVTFFDALYVPGSGKQGHALWPDVITVHHPAYYQGQGDQVPPPADWDSPTPIPFLTASGKYLVALAGPDEWVERAFDILGRALESEGIGAKTSSGYGRMRLEGVAGEPAQSGTGRTATAAPAQAAQPAEQHAKPVQQPTRHSGKIVRFYAQQRTGKIEEDGTGREFDFDDRALPKGWTPAYRQRPAVDFLVDPESGKVIEIRKKF